MRRFSPFKIGLTEEMDTEFRRITILTNVVYSILFVLLTGYLIFYFPNYLKLPQITWFTAVPWLAWLGVIGGLLLNKLRLHLVSKLVFIITWIGVVNILPAISGNARPSSFILYPMYCMITSVMIHLMFSPVREKHIYFPITLFTWGLIIFSPEFLSYFNPHVDLTGIFPIGISQFRIILIMIAAFFNAAIIYVIKINNQFYTSLQKRNNIISDQNIQLEDLRLKLEEKVQVRTNQLIEQNSKMQEYTFFNSHILRAPISRIRGLLNLLSMNVNPEEEKQVRELLMASMNELDQAVKSINSKLEIDESEKS